MKAGRQERAKRELSHFTTLFEAANQLARITDWGQTAEAFRIVTTAAAEQLHCLAVVRTYDDLSAELVAAASSGEGVKPFERMAVSRGIGGEVFRRRKTFLIHDVQSQPDGEPRPTLSDPKTRSLLIAPILIQDCYYGNFGLSHAQPNHFHPDDVTLVNGLAQLLAITLQRLDGARRQRELLERSKQVEAMAWIGETALGLAHRLGNDLGLIRSYVEDVREAIAEGRADDPKVNKSLEHIVSKASGVLELAAKLRSEVAEMKVVESASSISVWDLLDEVRDMPAASPLSVKLEIEVESGVGLILGTRWSVSDILRHLVINAVEAMPQGGGRLRIEAHNVGPAVQIRVSDDGSGILESERDKIFRLFYSTKGSSGFGLWSARRHALANGGTLELAQGAGPGATFILTLPRADRAPEARLDA